MSNFFLSFAAIIIMFWGIDFNILKMCSPVFVHNGVINGKQLFKLRKVLRAPSRS